MILEYGCIVALTISTVTLFQHYAVPVSGPDQNSLLPEFSLYVLEI